MISNKSFNSKHNVYYIDGKITKNFEELKKAIEDHKRVESFNKKTGQVRYLNYTNHKWLRVFED